MKPEVDPMPITNIDQVTIDILENFLDNIIVYNSEGLLLYACDKFWKDTKLTPEEFRGKGIREIKALGIYEPYATEVAFKTKEKATVVQQAFEDEVSVATSLPIRDKNGRIFIYVSYAENNKTIGELEGKLEQANKFLEKRNREISQILNKSVFIPEDVGESVEVVKVHKLIERIMDFDANVLLTGETGVGKTMYAKQIHFGSSRSNLPFVELNCAAIPETLLESELFGYEKGAFTGANSEGKIGQIELADRGTLFLDEISELSMNLQSKLLKVIQDKKISRIGGTEDIKVDFRLITATNKNLEDLVINGHFRTDLYYRLNVIPIKVPALRDRREDIIPLLRHYLNIFNKKYDANKFLSKQVSDFFIQYDWPGNVRELENTVERLVLTVEQNEITIANIPLELKKNSIHGMEEFGGIQGFLNRLEKQILTDKMNECHNNISEVARSLKLTRQSVLRRLEKYGIRQN